MFKPIIASAIAVMISILIAIAGSDQGMTYDGMPLFLMCATVPFILHWLGFIPAYFFQTEHYFDLIGSVSYVATIALAFLLIPALDLRAWLVGVAITLWAIRLGSFLFMRVKQTGQDRRFSHIKPHFFRFFFTWTLGATWVFITLSAGLAAISAQTRAPLDIYFYVGALLWLLGFIIEVIADQQKATFRRNPANTNRFISTGLWSISRHPNYFGEILLWLGIAIISVPVLAGWQWVTLISPLFVALLLIKISGIPLLENIAEERWGKDPDYRDYRKRTPVLIPSFSSKKVS